ncbi:HDOD domain-containing protein [Kaarinaea lacus]
MAQQGNLKSMSEDKQEPTIVDTVLERLQEVGDLPIFSASVNRVQLVSSDPGSDAMALAVEILKDANLSSKVLKLANSSYYNRGVVKIGTLSRAIVVLGFDAIKSSVLTLKMIDSFQHDHPGINMSSMLVNSYMSAGFVRDMASECGLKDIEQSYICGLLHNLGDVIIAFTMPEEYLHMNQLIHDNGMSSLEAQKKIFSMPIRKIGQEIVEKWEFPSSVVKTIAPFSRSEKGPIKNAQELNKALAALTNNMMDLLYSDSPNSKLSFKDVTKEIANITGASAEAVTNCLDRSFKQSCELAEEYGLDKKLLMPKVRGSSDDARDKIARQLSFYANSKGAEFEADQWEEAHCDDGYDDAPQEVVEADENSTPESCGDSNAMLGILHELTTMMTQKAHINSVFNKVLEGMHKGVGFDRAMLVLLTPDHKKYIGRMATGYQADELKHYFSNFTVNAEKDLFSKLIMEGSEILVPDVNQGGWADMLPPDFTQTVRANTFLIASIRVSGKPVGMFYADTARHNRAISADDHRGFMQLVAQAQLALQVR